MTEPGRKSTLCLLLAIVARSHAAPTRAYESYSPGICNWADSDFSEDETPEGFDGHGRCWVTHTPDECAEACEQTFGCEFFSSTQQNVGHCCFLHKTCEEPNHLNTANPYYTAYHMPTYDVYSSGICNWNNADFSEDETPAGFDGHGRCWTPHTPNQCAEACAQTVGCEFFSTTQQNMGHCCFLHRTCEEPNQLYTEHPDYTAHRMRVVATSTATTTVTVTTTTTMPKVEPGAVVEVKCESEDTYHLAEVNIVSSTSIVVAYEVMGYLYYCTPDVWRIPVANEDAEEGVCEPHGGILPAWGGAKCCPSSCGECGTTDCHTKPGGRDSCCTSRIPNHYVCGKDGRAAPCTLVPHLPFERSRRLRGDADVEDGEMGAVARLLRAWSPTAWFGV